MLKFDRELGEVVTELEEITGSEIAHSIEQVLSLTTKEWQELRNARLYQRDSIPTGYKY